MAKFLVNVFYACICLLIFETLLYIKDYNDLMAINSYLVYEIKVNKEELNSNKYKVKIERFDSGIKYFIEVERFSLIRIGGCKKIKYNGIVYLSDV